MSDLAALTADDFEPLVGTAFTAGPICLELTSVKRLPRQGGPREPFSLTFAGPRSDYLAQGSRPLSHEALGDLDLFLVPVGMTGDSFHYEAVFG